MNPLIGSALIGGAASLFGLGGSSSANMKMQKHAQEFQWRSMLAQQQWANAQRESAQDFQTSERMAQNDFALDTYQRFQSPAAQVAQLRQAGLNPNLAADVGSVGASSGSSSGSPSGPSAGGLPGVTPPYMPYNSMAGSFKDIAGALSALADAKKSGVETDRLKKFMDEELAKLKYGNIAQQILNSINQTKLNYLNQKESAELQKLLQDVANGVATEQEIRARLAKLGVEKDLIQKQVDNYERELNANIEHTESETSLNRAMEKTEDLRPANVEADTEEKRGRTKLVLSQAEIEDLKADALRMFRKVIGLDDVGMQKITAALDKAMNEGKDPVLLRLINWFLDDDTSDEERKGIFDSIAERLERYYSGESPRRTPFTHGKGMPFRKPWYLR